MTSQAQQLIVIVSNTITTILTFPPAPDAVSDSCSTNCAPSRPDDVLLLEKRDDRALPRRLPGDAEDVLGVLLGAG